MAWTADGSSYGERIKMLRRVSTGIGALIEPSLISRVSSSPIPPGLQYVQLDPRGASFGSRCEA